jgi:hypothetical protein
VTGLAASGLKTNAISLYWTPAPASSLLTGYRVERATAAAGPFTAIATVTTPYYTSGGLAANTAYYYRVRAVCGGLVSAPTAVAAARTLPVETITVQQDASGISSAGTWTTVPSTSLSGGSARRTTVAGSKITVPFRGTGVKLIATKSASAGKVDITLDGVKVATGLNLYSATTAYKSTVYTRTGLAEGVHNLVVTATLAGKTVDVDAFSVTGAAAGVNVEESAGTYAVSWELRRSTTYSGGTAKLTSTSGSNVTYTFRGTGITWLGARATSRGKAGVYIDNVYQGTIDQFASTTAYQSVVWRKTGLSNASHTIKIVVAGTRNAASSSNTIDVDAFVVR